MCWHAISPDAVANLAKARPEFVMLLPVANRLPRQQMVSIADSYFEAIEHANGKLRAIRRRLRAP
jgi:hypothetical protein